jgi:hypothetical protein
MLSSDRRSALHWLALPYWIAQLGTGAKSFADNPLIGSKRLNRRGLHTARVRIAHRLATMRRRRLAHLISDTDQAQFAQQGYIMVREFLPSQEFTKMRDAILARPAPAREMLQGDAITRRIAVDPQMLRDIPALKTLLRNKRWSRLMRYVASFNVEPLYYIQTILAHKVDSAPDPQTHLHADTFHPTMKAWYFLTDVADEDGPLTYVAGSHRSTPQRRAWEKAQALKSPEGVDRLSSRGSMRITPEELPALGLPEPTRFAVPANTLVVVDTNGFHARGLASRPSVRVELWAYSRRNPFVPWTGLDLLSLPGIAERRVQALWAVRDRLSKWIGQPWRPAGTITPNSNS